MGRLFWYKRFPHSALVGMATLTLEERGAYDTVLDLIYDSEDRLADDDRFISGWCKCDVRVWRRIRLRLLGLNKLHVDRVGDNAFLRNVRATSEVDEALHRRLSATNAARARHGKSPLSWNEFRGLDSAPAGAPAAGTDPSQSKKFLLSNQSLTGSARGRESTGLVHSAAAALSDLGRRRR